MQTVGDVIEFWTAYFDRERGSFYSDTVDNAARAMIVDDPEYWANNSMRALLDRAYEATKA